MFEQDVRVKDKTAPGLWACLMTYQFSADILRSVVIRSDVTSLCSFWAQLSRSCPSGSSPFMSEWVWWSPRTTAERLWCSHKTTVVCVTCHHLTTRHYLRRSGISAVPSSPHTHFDFFRTQASGWSEDVVSGVCLHFSRMFLDSKGRFTRSMPCPCRAHAVPMPFPCHAVTLIHTCHAAPLPCSDSAVSLVKVRVVAGNIRTASPTV